MSMGYGSKYYVNVIQKGFDHIMGTLKPLILFLKVIIL